MKKMVFKGVSVIVFITLFFSCSKSVDINNEEAVMKDVQGIWKGYQATGKMYRHFKLSVTNDLFEGWIQTSDSKTEPVWANAPDEKGTITLNSIQQDLGNSAKYRKFAFTCSGRCCGDKSISQLTLAKMITYMDGEGLTIDGKVKMYKQ